MANLPDHNGTPDGEEKAEGLFDAALSGGTSSGTPGAAVPGRGNPISRLLRIRGRTRTFWLIIASMGPGLVAANAGNDAGGIATYSSLGASTGYSLLWAFPLILISLSVVQEMSARMGAATGKGLSDLIRENFSIHVTALVLLALLVANGATVISEFVGIAVSIELVFPGGSQFILVPLIALALWLLVVRGSYTSVERIFLAMTLVFFAYPITAFIVHPHWGSALRDTVIPSVHWKGGWLLLFVATVGTSITPYMQVYIQSAVADKGITPRDYMPERIEVYAGSLFANLIAVFIVIATAATLFPHHPVSTAADAAIALRPLAGPNAFLLFATGLFGASMLAAAVLPLATAYSIAEALGVEKGVNLGFREAPVFMSIFTGLMALGVVFALILPGHLQFTVLIVIQVVDALLLPIVLFTILNLVNNRKLMGDMVNGPVYNTIARATAVIVAVLSLLLLADTILGWFGLSFLGG
ncbi:MAG: Nramp family divalent metal transporter [Chloroflexota bacterium]|nr:Nramp family divalent metal transporter [Chloroflexota bacterium]